jgi:hypothetical protein
MFVKMQVILFYLFVYFRLELVLKAFIGQASTTNCEFRFVLLIFILYI